jgi:uncharacterized protein (TIRG00374 family)
MLLSKRNKKIFSIIVGAAVLYYVFQKVDFEKLLTITFNANILLMLFGLCFAPLLVLVAITRWRFMIQFYSDTKIGSITSVKEYWKGLALGFFTPSSLGLDAYRVVIVSKINHKKLSNVMVIIAEKIFALSSAILVICALYPFLEITANRNVEMIFNYAYILSIIVIIGYGLALLLKKWSLPKRILLSIFNIVLTLMKKLISQFQYQYKVTNDDVYKFFNKMTDCRIVVPVLLSIAIQIISSVKSQIFFRAIGYDISFLTNLFVTPLLYFIFFLPISMGSLGIREGVYITIYGLFGVPAETALIVSFLNLSGMLVNNIIGGLYLIFWK